MGRQRLIGVDDSGDTLIPNSGIGFLWCPLDVNESHNRGGFFASVGQMGMGFGLSPNSPTSADSGLKLPPGNLLEKCMLTEPGFRIGGGVPELLADEDYELGEQGTLKEKKTKKGGFKLSIKVGNPSLRRLISGAIAGAVSRTSVAPLETIRTHLMVGSLGGSTTEVFQNIMKDEGWTGLFRGNLVNVIRVAPSKAIEV